jgi:DNA-binding transcriptional MocR family regulator
MSPEPTKSPRTAPANRDTAILSRAIQGARPSGFRDLLALTQRPGMISLAGGLPAAEHFDVAGLKTAFAAALDEAPSAALQYGMIDGQPAFRDALARQITGDGLSLDGESLIVTTGSQQAVDLIARCLIDPGDVVAVAQPTYLAALQAFSLAGARFVSIPSDSSGACVEDLARLKGRERPKLIYLVPHFANPSGTTLSAARRQWIVRWAEREHMFVLEDDPYRELSFAGAPLLSIKSLAQSQGKDASRWIGYTSSLSKSVAPGLRLGWLMVPDYLRDPLTTLKEATDFHTPTATQEAVARYLDSGRLAAHLPVLRRCYAERAAVLRSALVAGFGDRLEIPEIEGGMFLWARFRDGTSARVLLDRAIRHGVLFVPGDAFYVEEPDSATLRLNFSASPPERLREGVRRLATAHAELGLR